jgi:sulfite reductase (ferredoxin)
VRRADALAYEAMVQAAKALVKTQFHDVGDDPARIVAEFKTRFVDTELFFDRFAKGMVAGYLFRRHEHGPGTVTAESAHHLVEEASLFVEAGHACQLRITEKKIGPAAAAASQVVSLEGLN